jgi:alpha,alpha-trehalase
MANAHLAAIEATLTPENWSGRILVRSALDGRIVNAGVERYRQLNGRHLEPLRSGGVEEDGIDLLAQTNQSHIQVAEAARTQVFCNGHEIRVRRRRLEERGFIAQELEVDQAQGEPVVIEKIVALYTSRDHAISECRVEAGKAVRRAGRFEDLLRSHILAWERLWSQCNITLKGQQRTQLLLRLHTFHLLQTVSMHTIDLDAGVPSRGLHGEAYRGHILWDELFIFPTLNLHLPELTRALLLYRYRRLPEARWAAQQVGYKGAMYPWQSGSNGREESQVIHLNPISGRWIPDNSHLQRHVNAAIAYNVWQYYQATADIEFLSLYGAEMILEIGRFWASLTSYNRDLNRYEIRGVMGPDEYHDAYPWADEPGLNNHAYTNIMAVWTLQCGLNVLNLLAPDRREELRAALDLPNDELQYWQDITRKMRIVFHGDGIISQFEGYEALDEFDWQRYRQKYGNIQRLDRILEGEGDTPNRYKVSKQADVLMLFYLFSADELRGIFQQLGYPFAYETIPKNVDYYLRRTSHGSTLSCVVHSWVLARSDRTGSWRLFTEALDSDVSDMQGGTTQEGIHLGAMAGTVDLVQRCYIGIEMRDEVLWLNPRLPEDLQGLSLTIRYRSHWLTLDVTHDKLTVSFRIGWARTAMVGFRDQIYEFRAGDVKEFAL